jgi:hypothetical protein
MIKLAIAMSMHEFEEEQKKKEEEEKQKAAPKNALAESLLKEGALNKYSKQGFVPKNLK